MSDSVLVYKGDEIASYGFGDPHPFGFDRHDVFQQELVDAGLDSKVEFGRPRRATVDELLLFHTAEYIDLVSRKSAEGRGYLDEGDTPAIASLEMSPNFPNPFNPSTTIRFSQPAAGFVELTVYDVRGARVVSLLREHRQKGWHTVEWNGRNDHGEQVSSGVYFYRLVAGAGVVTRKMVLLK